MTEPTGTAPQAVSALIMMLGVCGVACTGGPMAWVCVAAAAGGFAGCTRVRHSLSRSDRAFLTKHGIGSSDPD